MNQLELFLIVIIIMIGGIFSMTSIETAFSRQLPKEVRGIMNGVQSLFGTLGGLWLTKLGGYMYDIYGPKSPFIVVAITNGVFAVFVAILGATGKFKH